MMTAEQLKASILQMAMQGKLVEQRAEEGTGEELFQRIQNVQQELIKSNQIKKNKKHVDLTEDEIPFDVPETWKWTKLSEIIDFRMGKTPPRAEMVYWADDIPWVSIADMIDGKVISETKEGISKRALEEKFGGQISPKGTLIMSFKLTVGKVSVLGMDAVHNEAIISVIPFVNDDFAIRNYLLYMLPFLSTLANSKKAIMGFTLNSTSLSNLPVPLPPLEEQKRIVAKIEELMPFVEQYAKASTRLNTLNASFPEQMKKSILQQAVMGELVPQDPNDEPASVLLKKIAEEKQKLIKEGKIKKEQALDPISEDEIPFDIPENWKWARLGSLITVRGGKRLPAGKQLVTEKTDHIYIRVTDMKNETVDMSDLRYLTDDIYEGIKSYIIKKEDIFIVIVGSTIGKAGIIPDELDGMNLTENAARLTPYYVDKEFLLKMITSDFMQSQFIDKTHQVGQPKLAIFRLKDSLIPVPPLNEQKRIVQKLKELIPQIDVLRTETK